MSKLTTLRQLVISIHALHEESDLRTPETSLTEEISIHALHEESDLGVPPFDERLAVISIHALHEESDCCRRGAFRRHRYFNPRSP